MRICRRQIFFSLVLILLLLVDIAAASDLPVSSSFGWRIHPIYGDWRFHAGLDLAYDLGTPVLALFDGNVVMAGDYGGGYGNQVFLYHASSDTYTRYAHCMAIYVFPGDSVSAGNVIAMVGSTGDSTGPHLHLEYIVSDGNGGYVYADPILLWQ